MERKMERIRIDDQPAKERNMKNPFFERNKNMMEDNNRIGSQPKSAWERKINAPTNDNGGSKTQLRRKEKRKSEEVTQRCEPPSIPVDQESRAILKEMGSMELVKINLGLNIRWLSDSMWGF
jgi:hypothetical protein